MLSSADVTHTLALQPPGRLQSESWSISGCLAHFLLSLLMTDEQRAWTHDLDPKTYRERIAMPCAYHHERMMPMIAVSQYKVARLTPDDHPCLDSVQHLLDAHAREGWELVTAFQFDGAGGQSVDQMIQSLSNMTSTVFIFKRAA